MDLLMVYGGQDSEKGFSSLGEAPPLALTLASCAVVVLLTSKTIGQLLCCGNSWTTHLEESMKNEPHLGPSYVWLSNMADSL